ncbi:MAG TPA: carboxypeptidase regulatory-like domain-containing protein [Bacteroidia bacterium]|nr:carboxypeptidase regulatory-like domain-containing protein [Bacteroidia bacterium]
MKHAVLLFFFLLGLCTYSQKDNTSNLSSPGDISKMSRAKQKLYAGDYRSALNLYIELEKNNPNNSTVKYYMAYCQFHLSQIPTAKENLNKAIELNKDLKPETHLLLAEVLQTEGDFNAALSQLDIFSEKTRAMKMDEEKKEEATYVRSQCQSGKDLTAKPLDVEIKNMGAGINSKWDDKNPCITADGSKLVFTTRRPETTNSERDVEGDGGYYENIYIVQRDSATGDLLQAQAAGGAINSLAHDACTSISADGKQIFIYKNDASRAESRGGNVFVSKIKNDKWGAPASLGKPINTSYWEGGVCMSPDGKRYFFSSERKGGFGRSDIWMVEKINKNEWSKPMNLGSEVNSAYDEAGMFLAPDGKTLFFCSNGPKSMGSYDIFKTVYENGTWSVPENLGYPINTSAKEGQITLSADARTAYFSSDRKGGYGENDIYKTDLRSISLLEKAGQPKENNGLSIVKGTIREGYEGYGMAETEIVMTHIGNGQVNSTLTNESGEYFFTLPAGQYKLEVKKKGYTTITEQLELPQNAKETPVIEKGFLLKK